MGVTCGAGVASTSGAHEFTYNAFTAIFLTFKTKDFATDNNGFEIVTKNKIVERNY